MKNITLTVGEYIKRLRQNRNFSQIQVAILLGVSQSTFSRFENDTLKPNLEQILRLYDIIGFSLDHYYNLSKKQNRIKK